MAGLAALAKKAKKKAAESKPEGKFLKLIDTFLETEANKPRENQRLAIRPSSFGQCLRRQWYFLTNTPQKGVIKGRNARILRIGTLHHEYIQDEVLAKIAEQGHIELVKPDELVLPEGVKVMEQNFSSPIEIKLLDERKEIPVSMMVDGHFSMDGTLYIFEYKTINPKDYAGLKEPLVEHRIQGSLYAYEFGVRNVMFLYENKGTQELKPFLYEVSDEQIQWVEDRIDTIIEFVRTKTIPPAEASYKCTYCPYAYTCDRGVEDAKEAV